MSIAAVWAAICTLIATVAQGPANLFNITWQTYSRAATAQHSKLDALGALISTCCWLHIRSRLVSVQMTMDVLGRPTLLQVHNTVDQAISDVRNLAEDMEQLLDFLARPETEATTDDVSNVLGHWGPNLAALSSKAEAARSAGDAAANGPSNALVLVGQGHHSARAAAAGVFGGLDPAAARRLARQCAAKGSSVLLGQLSKQLNLIEQCLVIVLLHLVQVGCSAAA